MLVHKTRRVSRFFLASGSCRAGLSEPGEEPGCAVEVTEVRVRGEAWWTLGFEATGPARTLRSELEAAAALVFAHPLGHRTGKVWWPAAAVVVAAVLHMVSATPS